MFGFVSELSAHEPDETAQKKHEESPESCSVKRRESRARFLCSAFEAEHTMLSLFVFFVVVFFPHVVCVLEPPLIFTKHHGPGENADLKER